MNIDTDVLDVLSNAVINENALKLTGQLDRKLYESTNKVLVAAGGKWDRKAKAHLFSSDASEIIDQIILTGVVTDRKKELGYYPTPANIVDMLITQADIRTGMRVLEPSAGRGAIVQGIFAESSRTVFCYEIDPENVKFLKNNALAIEQHLKCLTHHSLHVTLADFLTVVPTPTFDRVVMNPPFVKQADIHHVLHAHRFLKPGGSLVAVMSAGVQFRTNKLTTQFRQFVDDHDGSIESLPEGSFTESGTNVNTVMVTIEA